MITMSYLLEKPSYHANCTPATYSLPGYYPGSYSVVFDAKQGVYEILFGELKRWHAAKLATST
jgi:hypothetical protein